jgi:hypothetical protein
MKKNITKGKYAVIEKNGKLIAVKEAKSNLLIECPDDVIVTEKTKSKLKKSELDKVK